jgi:hypothetical protein
MNPAYAGFFVKKDLRTYEDYKKIPSIIACDEMKKIMNNELQPIPDKLFTCIHEKIASHFQAIRAANAELERSMNTTLVRAAQLGKRLAEMKAAGEQAARELGYTRPHEWGFMKAVEMERLCSPKHANQYIKLFSEYPKLLESDYPTSGNPILTLPYSSVFELLGSTEEVKAEVESLLESGEAVTLAEIRRSNKIAREQRTGREKLLSWAKKNH